MKKTLLIIGIVVIVLAVLVLLFGALWMSAFYGTHDASHEFYEATRKKMIISFIIGTVLAVLGIIITVLSKVR